MKFGGMGSDGGCIAIWICVVLCCVEDVHKKNKHDGHAAQHQGLAADALKHEPAEDGADGAEPVLAPTD